MSSNEDEIGTYVDVKFNSQDWCVGRILEKDKDFLTIRLDGMLTKNDLVFLTFCFPPSLIILETQSKFK